MLHHGDCLGVLPTLADGSVDMVFADLPYGVTANTWDSVIPFDPLWADLLRVGKLNAAFVFTATQPFTSRLVTSQERLFKYPLVWEKERSTGFYLAKKQPMRNHEDILVFYRAQPVYNPQKTPGKPYSRSSAKTGSSNYGEGVGNYRNTNSNGLRYPLSIVRVPRDNAQRTHPTQKPVALLEWLVKTYSNPGDTVLDPTMGSGTTGIACVNTGRKFVGIEKDAGFFAISEQRIANAAKGQIGLQGVA